MGPHAHLCGGVGGPPGRCAACRAHCTRQCEAVPWPGPPRGRGARGGNGGLSPPPPPTTTPNRPTWTPPTDPPDRPPEEAQVAVVGTAPPTPLLGPHFLGLRSREP